VSGPAQRTGDLDAATQDGAAGEPARERETLPVLAHALELEHEEGSPRLLARARTRERTSLPAVQAAAVAAGGFVAGAAVAGLVHRRGRRSAAALPGARAGRALSSGARKGARGAGAEMLQIVASRTLLVDVHLLGIPHADR
jgi:hypothetical protein